MPTHGTGHQAEITRPLPETNEQGSSNHMNALCFQAQSPVSLPSSVTTLSSLGKESATASDVISLCSTASAVSSVALACELDVSSHLTAPAHFSWELASYPNPSVTSVSRREVLEAPVERAPRQQSRAHSCRGSHPYTRPIVSDLPSDISAPRACLQAPVALHPKELTGKIPDTDDEGLSLGPGLPNCTPKVVIQQAVCGGASVTCSWRGGKDKRTVENDKSDTTTPARIFHREDSIP